MASAPRRSCARGPSCCATRPTDPAIVLRPLRVDRRARTGSACAATTPHYVQPWEPTLPPGSPPRAPVSFRQFVRDLDTEARADRAMPWCIEVGGRIVGQVHLFGIVRAAQQSGAAGYWLDESVTGRGIATRALALAIDHALGPGGLHRVEVNIRLDNVPSLRVVERLGLRDEGVRERFLHIDGAWRDHRSFAVTTEDLAGSTPHRPGLSHAVTPASCATRLECARRVSATSAYRGVRASQQPHLRRHRGDLGCLPRPALGPPPRGRRRHAFRRRLHRGHARPREATRPAVDRAPHAAAALVCRQARPRRPSHRRRQAGRPRGRVAPPLAARGPSRRAGRTASPAGGAPTADHDTAP